MRPWVQKSIKAVVALVAISALLVGAGLVGFRVLVKQLPSYQDDLQAWVNDALGVRLTFASVDARWGWRGPELTFRDASLAAADDAAPFLKARVASVGVGMLALAARLLTQRELGVDRLTFEGTELTIVQTEDGQFSVQGAAASAAPISRSTCRPTSRCWCATAACCTSISAAASCGTSRTWRAACAARRTRC
jgi:uncharacterized protein YhdP